MANRIEIKFGRMLILRAAARSAVVMTLLVLAVVALTIADRVGLGTLFSALVSRLVAIPKSTINRELQKSRSHSDPVD